MGIGNDLFDGVSSLQRLICPSKNAFSHYTEILEKAKKLGKDKLVLIALGPTATVLSYDLARAGFWGRYWACRYRIQLVSRKSRI